MCENKLDNKAICVKMTPLVINYLANGQSYFK